MNIKFILENIKNKCEKNRYYPIFNAFHTFIYTPKKTTYTGSHIRDGSDMKRVMFIVILSLIPCLIFGAYNTGYQYYIQIKENISLIKCFLFGIKKIIPIIIVSYVVGLSIEFIFAIIRKHEVSEGFLVTGLLIPLIVPIDIPLWMIALSIIFSVIFAKEAFGGTGMNVFNPALVSRAFLFFSYPKEISGDKVWVHNGNLDGISGESIIGLLTNAKSDTKIIQDIVLHNSHISVTDMFFGLIPGSIGETSIVAILIGAIILIITDVASWKIMVSAIIGASLIGYIFNIWGINALMAFPWWKHLIIGGFAFGIVFMATDPVSASQTEIGKWIYGFFIGLFSILIRIFNPAYSEGVMMAILLMNMFAPTIDYFVIQTNINKRINRLKKNSI